MHLISRPTMRRNSADGRVPKLDDARPQAHPELKRRSTNVQSAPVPTELSRHEQSEVSA